MERLRAAVRLALEKARHRRSQAGPATRISGKRWLRVLQRRSQKSRMSWKHLTGFATQWLPRPKILHPYPCLRFDAKYLR